MVLSTRTYPPITFLCLAAVAAACGPDGQAGQSELSLQLRFASLRQAQTGQTDLPADLAGLQVDARDQEIPDAPVLATTGCIGLEPDSAERGRVSLDLEPGAGLMLTVTGWAGKDCADEPSWRGTAWDVTVANGEETVVAIYVTRLGRRLNPIRGSLPSPRAFATATPIPNHRVLIAGGFDRLEQGALQAACDAVIYDPASATVERVIPLAGGCRGLHRALPLLDGTVLLVGGCEQTVFDPAGSTRPMLRPKVETLFSSAELFDPATGSFGLLQADDALQRAEAAAVLLDDESVVLLGGRTNMLRSSEIVIGEASASGSWDWLPAGSGMLAERSSARALSLNQGILVVGGNLPGQAALELLDPESLESTALEPEGTGLPDLSLSGHSLTPAAGSSFVLAGGALNAPGSVPADHLLRGAWTGATYSLQAYTMARPRAFHAAFELAGAEPACVFAGGLDESLRTTPDLELAEPGQDGQLLPDELEIGAVGAAAAILPDGSALLVGGLDVGPGGSITLSAAGQILTP